MIATKPDFIQGDELTLKQYIDAIIANKRLLFRSKWSWWKKTTFFWLIPLIVIDVAIFVALFYNQYKNAEGIEWSFISISLMLPFMSILPLIWYVSYYHSFIQSTQVTEKLTTFVSKHIVGAELKRKIAHSNYIFSWNGLELEAAYSFVPTLNKKGKVLNYQECFIICLHYKPNSANRSEIVDSNGMLLDSFREKWDSYCRGKESCKFLRVEDYSIYAFMRADDIQNKEQIQLTMEQMQYLVKRFGLVPLYMSDFIYAEIKHWLRVIDHPVTEDIVALNIGVFRDEDGYFLYLTGSKTYNADNDDWIRNEDFEPDEIALEIPMGTSSEEDWEEFQEQTKEIVMNYVQSKAEDKDSLFYHKIVTIGVEGKDLIKICGDR